MNTVAISKISKSSTCSGSDIKTIDIAAASKTLATNDNHNENNVVVDGFSEEDIITEPHDHVSRLLLLSDLFLSGTSINVVIFFNL
jgi:hypothetical protein